MASDQCQSTDAPDAVVDTTGASTGLDSSTFTCTESLEEFPTRSEHEALSDWAPSPVDADCCVQFASSTPAPASVQFHATDTSELFHPPHSRQATPPGHRPARSCPRRTSTSPGQHPGRPLRQAESPPRTPRCSLRRPLSRSPCRPHHHRTRGHRLRHRHRPRNTRHPHHHHRCRTAPSRLCRRGRGRPHRTGRRSSRCTAGERQRRQFHQSAPCCLHHLLTR